uniref:Uncharacterized protein n=1 Tax=Schistosoma curassoni TaxID=6186 RepID=A0A183KAB5_9TREM
LPISPAHKTCIPSVKNTGSSTDSTGTRPTAFNALTNSVGSGGRPITARPIIGDVVLDHGVRRQHHDLLATPSTCSE